MKHLPRRFGLLACGLTAGFFFLSPSGTETAEANGDTRTISLYHSHTGESIEATYRVNGHYDQATLDRLNWFLRDWRTDEPTKMDPRLFDVVWETYRAAGANQPIVVYSAYRSPQTNAMLRRRSRAVAEFSQHMLGKAMDTTMPGMPMEKIREFGMRMQRGGVGYYPSANFVHLDVGSVRHWPRMSYDQLSRLFPDGKTVHIPSNGQPLARYAEARAEIEANGGIAEDVPKPASQGFFAWLFGAHDNAEEAEAVPRSRPAARTQIASTQNTVPPISSIAWRSAAYTANAGAESAGLPGNANNERAAAGHRIEAQSGTMPKSAAVPVPVKPDPKLYANFISPVREAETKPVTKREDLAANLPAPPPRPAELLAYADVPVPPAKPLSYAALAAPLPADGVSPKAKDSGGPINRLLTETADKSALQRAASLPVIITEGSAQGSKQAIAAGARTPGQVLAYAPAARLQGLRAAANAKVAISEAVSPAANMQKSENGGAGKPIAAVQVRRDRSNTRSFAANAETGHPSAQNAAGQKNSQLTERFAALIFANSSVAGSATVFAARASELESDRFSSKAFEPAGSGGN